MKTTITHNEYLQLVGLRTVAQNLWKQIAEVEKAAVAITGETDAIAGGHTSDMINGDRNLDEGLKILKITVQD